MRTVDDLRAALTSLEGEAPDFDGLLSGSARATQPVRRRAPGWVLPSAAAGAMIAVFLAVAALVTLPSGPGQASGAGHTSSRAPAGGHGRLLPFRLTRSLPQLQLLDVRSDANPGNASGTAVVAEYGMEVTIDVSTALGQSTRSSFASPVAVGGVHGWIDTSCGVRAAASSTAAPSDPASSSTVPTFNPTCGLSYDSGPWHVDIYVAGPGGGSRKITSRQFLQIGDHLQLADSPSDSSTWFASDELLPS